MRNEVLSSPGVVPAGNPNSGIRKRQCDSCRLPRLIQCSLKRQRSLRPLVWSYEEVRTEALKVLHDTVEQSQSEAFASIPDESILRRIEPDSASLTVPLCELSGVALKHHALTHI